MKKIVKTYGEEILFQVSDDILYNLYNERLKKLVPITNALMKISNHKYTDRPFLLRTTAEYLYLIISHQEEEKKLTFYQIQRVNMMLIQFMFTEIKKIMKTQSKDDSKYDKKEKTVEIVTKFFSIMQIKRLLSRRKR